MYEERGSCLWQDNVCCFVLFKVSLIGQLGGDEPNSYLPIGLILYTNQRQGKSIHSYCNNAF